MAAASRPGPHHLRNEDAWCAYVPEEGEGADRPCGLFAVCDGVSTAGRGRLAAELACERLSQFGEPEVPRTLNALVQLVSEIDWELRGAGDGAYCTLATVWVHGDIAHVVTVGDSPVFRVRKGRLKQAGTERTGVIRKGLRAYLGMGPAVLGVLEHDRWTLEPGDVLLLMSDGILDALDEDDLMAAWERTRDPVRCVEEILQEVARVGVDDDATLVLVELRVEEDAVSPTAPHEAPDPPRQLLPSR